MQEAEGSGGISIDEVASIKFQDALMLSTSTRLYFSVFMRPAIVLVKLIVNHR